MGPSTERANILLTWFFLSKCCYSCLKIPKHALRHRLSKNAVQLINLGDQYKVLRQKVLRQLCEGGGVDREKCKCGNKYGWKNTLGPTWNFRLSPQIYILFRASATDIGFLDCFVKLSAVQFLLKVITLHFHQLVSLWHCVAGLTGGDSSHVDHQQSRDARQPGRV